MAFQVGHKHSAKPRKRRTLSESMLYDSLERSGESALLLFESTFKNENDDPKITINDRLQAANSWSKLVFLQPKEDEIESLTNINLSLEQHEELNKFLILNGISPEQLSSQKELMLKTSEFVKGMTERNV